MLAEAVGWARFGRARGLPTQPVRLGRYELRQTLGHGGMGHVFAAWDPELMRCVALKVLDRADPEAIVVARHEARCLARLAHPNVVRVHEVGEAELEGVEPIEPDSESGPASPPFGGRRAYVAMELIEAKSLRELRTSWRATLDHLLAAGRGLAAVHEVGLVHGDFKPNNVLLGRDGIVRVIDFGLARALASEAGSSGAAMFVERAGTVPYMAPERLEGGPPDPAADQWAFCVTAWELLFGVLPFGALTSAESILAAIASGRIQSGRMASGARAGRWRGWWRRPPAALERVLRRGLAEDPGARHPSMRALLAALERGGEGPERRGARARQGATGALLTLSLVGLGVLGRERSRCVDEVEALDRRWGALARAHLYVRFMSADLPAPRADFEWTAGRLDRWTSQWRDAWAQACRECGVGSSEAAQAELACLRSQRDQLDALLELLLEPSDELVRAARGLVAQLEIPGVCDSGADLAGVLELASTERRLALAIEAGALNQATLELAQLEREASRLVARTGDDPGDDPSDDPSDRAELTLARWRVRLAIERGELDLARELVRDALGRAELAGSALDDLRLALLFERLRLHARTRAPTLESIRDDGLAALSLVERSGSAVLHLAWAQAYGEALARVDVEAGLAVLEPAYDQLTRSRQGSPRIRLELLISTAELLDRAGDHPRARQRWQSALALAESLHGAHAIELVPVLRGLARNGVGRRDPRATRDAFDRLARLVRFERGGEAPIRALARELGVPID